MLALIGALDVEVGAHPTWRESSSPFPVAALSPGRPVRCLAITNLGFLGDYTSRAIGRPCMVSVSVVNVCGSNKGKADGRWARVGRTDHAPFE